MTAPLPENTTIAVVGLGYVGLPLAVEFGKKFKTISSDLFEAKVAAYCKFKIPPAKSDLVSQQLT